MNDQPRRHSLLGPLFFFVVIMIAGIALVAGWWVGRHGFGLPATLPETAAALRYAQPNVMPDIASDDRIADVTEVAMPAVVNVFSEKVIRQQPMVNPFYRFFFGPESRPRQRLEQSLGSGVIITDDGYLLTNNHVVEGADSIRVATEDKREFEARVIGTDPMTDLAVLKIEAQGLPTLSLGDSDKVRVGQMVLAIGDPFGLSGTVTLGIVSARGRSQMGITDYEDFIQTDAAINPGNSGGALINLKGELIGINTAIFSRSGGSMGIGFAIPSNLARRVMESIIAHGSVKRGYLGVKFQDLNPQLARRFGLNEPRGALIAEVIEGSPAAEGGLQPGDIIVEITGKKVDNYTDLRNRIADQTPGAEIDVGFLRQGQPFRTKVLLRERPKEMIGQQGSTPGPGPGGLVAAGMKIMNLSPEIADQLGIEGNVPGVAVVDVAPGSPADRAGVMLADVIMMVNRMPARNLEEFRRAAETSERAMLLHIRRQGQNIFLLVPLR